MIDMRIVAVAIVFFAAACAAAPSAPAPASSAEPVRAEGADPALAPDAPAARGEGTSVSPLAQTTPRPGGFDRCSSGGKPAPQCPPP